MAGKNLGKKYKIKIREFLDEKDALELNQYLSIRGNQIAFAREIGKTPSAVCGWIERKKFPKYCGLFLKKLKIEEFLK